MVRWCGNRLVTEANAASASICVISSYPRESALLLPCPRAAHTHQVGVGTPGREMAPIEMSSRLAEIRFVSSAERRRGRNGASRGGQRHRMHGQTNSGGRRPYFNSLCALCDLSIANARKHREPRRIFDRHPDDPLIDRSASAAQMIRGRMEPS